MGIAIQFNVQPRRSEPIEQILPRVRPDVIGLTAIADLRRWLEQEGVPPRVRRVWLDYRPPAALRPSTNPAGTERGHPGAAFRFGHGVVVHLSGADREVPHVRIRRARRAHRPCR